MGFGNVVLGLAFIATGVHSLRKGAAHLSGKAPSGGLFDGLSQPFASSGRKVVRAPNGKDVAMRMRSYNIRTLDDRIAYLRKLVDEGKRDPQVYAFARRATTAQCGNGWCVEEKDNLGEARALYTALRKNVRYTSDISGVDTYQKPSHTLSLKSGDCLPAGTMILCGDGRLVPIEDINVGDEVFDGNGWAKVTNWWDKGVQTVRALRLNNGSTLRCTDEHKLFTVPRTGKSAGTASSAFEVLAKDVKIGDDLLQPREMAFAYGKTLEPEAAFLLGAFLAEGSIRRRRVDDCVACVEIAGIPDSKGIRERALLAAQKLGFRVTELERMIYLTDSGEALNDLVGDCGGISYMKRLPHVRWSAETAKYLLEGLNADGGYSTSGSNFVFSTTSPELAVQYRILQRLQGKSCSIKRVDDHGGLGTHPIYRVTVREDNTRRPWASVKAISEAGEEHVYDFETDSHRFYLPEQDIVVHNCDDYSSLTCAALGSLGIPCRFKVIRTKDAGDWNHIYPQAGFPRGNPQRWVSMDSSVNMPFGWEAPPKMVAASRTFRVG